MTPDVVSVNVVGNESLMVVFADGARRIFHVTGYFKYPVYKVLQEPAYFSRARVEYGTVIWPDGPGFDSFLSASCSAVTCLLKFESVGKGGAQPLVVDDRGRLDSLFELSC